jgi:hypothetical protein
MKLAACVAFALILSPALLGCGDDDDDAPPRHPQGVGNYCEADTDCPTGVCYIGPGGGYCTAECEDEGDTAACPVDTVCKPIQGGPARCLLICGSDTSCGSIDDCGEQYCPNGSSCVAVSMSDFAGCEPDPG